MFHSNCISNGRLMHSLTSTRDVTISFRYIWQKLQYWIFKTSCWSFMTFLVLQKSLSSDNRHTAKIIIVLQHVRQSELNMKISPKMLYKSKQRLFLQKREIVCLLIFATEDSKTIVTIIPCFWCPACRSPPTS